MSIGREELLNQARREREALGRTIQYADPSRWDLPSARSGWSNRDVVAHLASRDSYAASIVAGEEPQSEESGPSTRSSSPFREIVGEWGQSADRLLAHAAKIDPGQWDGRTAGWRGENMAVSDLVQMCLAGWWIHGEDVRAGVDLAPRIEHWPMFLLNDLAIRRLPVSLAKTGRDYSGASVRITLLGAGGGRWHQGLSARVIPHDEKRPEVIIDGNAHAFALCASERVSADVFLDNGDLVLEGDEETGFDIFENISAFAS